MLMNRLRPLLLATIPVYTLWISFVLSVGRVVAPLELVANIVLGLLAGGLAVFLSDHTADRLYLRDALLNVAFYAVMAALFGAFSLRGSVDFATVDYFTNEVAVDRVGIAGYLGQFAWRGAVVGGLLWFLAGVNAGYVRGGSIGNGLAATLTLVGLFLAPVAANTLFNGALFVVVAVGTRLTIGLLVPLMSVWWQGFCFGTLAGLLLVLLPFIGFYGYGAL